MRYPASEKPNNRICRLKFVAKLKTRFKATRQRRLTDRLTNRRG
jgi:hypothetical protein